MIFINHIHISENAFIYKIYKEYKQFNNKKIITKNEQRNLGDIFQKRDTYGKAH